MRQFTLASLFDGIEGFPYAASFYNIASLRVSEIILACVSVTKKHFPDMAHAGDITQLHGGKLPPVDIVTFGSPCQGLSLAGQRRGLADEILRLCCNRSQRPKFQFLDLENGRTPEWYEAEALISLGACTTLNYVQ